MTGWVPEFRLIPVVLAATVSLLALKTFGLIFDGGFTLGQRMNSNGTLVVTTVPVPSTRQLSSPSTPLEIAQGAPKRSWMQDVFNYPGGDITGSVHGAPKAPEKKADEGTEAKKEQPKEPPPDPANGGKVIATDLPQRPASPSERALLERLQERRQELDARARELDMREGMMKTQEKKDETEPGAQKADAKALADAKRQEEAENSRFKAIVAMYESMKPKDAAKIFDRLDIKVLLDMASQIKPQVMAAILSSMSPEVAERLTMEMAVKSGSDRGTNPNNLPKIDGRPGGP